MPAPPPVIDRHAMLAALLAPVPARWTVPAVAVLLCSTTRILQDWLTDHRLRGVWDEPRYRVAAGTRISRILSQRDVQILERCVVRRPVTAHSHSTKLAPIDLRDLGGPLLDRMSQRTWRRREGGKMRGESAMSSGKRHAETVGP